MAEETEKSALEKIAEILSAHEVEFIVVGGQAELLMGSPRVDLIAIKEHLRRPKDQQSLLQLLAIKKVQEEFR